MTYPPLSESGICKMGMQGVRKAHSAVTAGWYTEALVNNITHRGAPPPPSSQRGQADAVAAVARQPTAEQRCMPLTSRQTAPAACSAACRGERLTPRPVCGCTVG